MQSRLLRFLLRLFLNLQGSSIIRMLSYFLTEDLFKKGLQVRVVIS